MSADWALQTRLPQTLTATLEALASEYEADLELAHTQQEGVHSPELPVLPMQQAIQAAIEVSLSLALPSSAVWYKFATTMPMLNLATWLLLNSHSSC